MSKCAHMDLFMSSCHLCVVASYCFFAPYTIDFLDIVFPLIPDVSSCDVLSWFTPPLVGDVGGPDRLLSTLREDVLRLVCGKAGSFTKKERKW